jgi:hypothetical protein
MKLLFYVQSGDTCYYTAHCSLTRRIVAYTDVPKSPTGSTVSQRLIFTPSLLEMDEMKR